MGAYVSYGTGHHAASWRHPHSEATANRDFDHYKRVAHMAEDYCFDALFLSDAPAVFNDDQEGYSGRVASFEPLTLVSALSQSTTEIGLIATASTTYNEPYNLARQFASLDHISNGRAAWNLVTTSKIGAAQNFGPSAHPDHSHRYERAEEFIDIVKSLWDTWDDDAFPCDKVSGRYYEKAKRHRTKYIGNHFNLNAELNVHRPIQGHPVLVQAGSSPAGKRLAARTAEVVFTAQQTLDSSRKFANDLDTLCSRYPRLNPKIIIMPGLTIYTGPTTANAEEKVRHLQDLVEPEFGISMLEDLLGGYDLSSCDPSDPLPVLPPSNANKSRRALIEKLAYEDGLNIKALYEHMTTSRGHLTLIGSYDEVANEMERWFLAGAADGFNIMPPLMPKGFEEFGEHIIPRLQSKGILKEKYFPGTLREKFGLKKPNRIGN